MRLARIEIGTTDALAPSFWAGDLVLATTVPAADLERGDVVSVATAGAGSGRLERVLGIEPRHGGGWAVTSAANSGDARATERAHGSIAWAPTLRVPVVGGVVAAALEPSSAVPALAAVLLLGAVVLIGGAPPAPVSRHAEPADDSLGARTVLAPRGCQRRHGTIGPAAPVPTVQMCKEAS